MDKREAIVAAALSYEGTRWRHQGRMPGVGLDCAGVIICAHRDAGLLMIDNENYARLPHPAEMRRYLDANTRPVAHAEPGDIVWLQFGGDPQHLALVVGENRIVHGYMRARRVVVQRFDAALRARLVQCYRHRSLMDE